jgi:hypothetical protein
MVYFTVNFCPSVLISLNKYGNSAVIAKSGIKFRLVQLFTEFNPF